MRIEFTDKKMTAYGASVCSRGSDPYWRELCQWVGIYSKVLAYILLIYVGGSRFSHLLYLGWQEVFTDLFGVRRLPSATTTSGRIGRKIRKMKEVEEMSEGLWAHLSRNDQNLKV